MDSRADASTDSVTEMISLLIVTRVCVDRRELGLILETVGVEDVGVFVAFCVVVDAPDVDDNRSILREFEVINLLIYRKINI